MTELHFAKPCTFTGQDGVPHTFSVGRHPDVSPEIANHWFVKEHLAKDVAEPAVPESAPLTHEERVKVKAAMDAAEARAKGAEAERDVAVSRADDLQAKLDAEIAAHAETRALLEEATAPEGDELALDGAPRGPYAIARGGQGSYKLMKDGAMVEAGLSKADAQAKADEFNAKLKAGETI